MKLDVIVPSTNQVTAILLQETRAIPIVFAFVGDPVGNGFVTSLPQPGGNVTGFANFENSIGGKWLEILTELTPKTKRVGFTRRAVREEVRRDLGDTGGPIEIEVEYRFGSGRR